MNAIMALTSFGDDISLSDRDCSKTNKESSLSLIKHMTNLSRETCACFDIVGVNDVFQEGFSKTFRCVFCEFILALPVCIAANTLALLHVVDMC